MSCHGEQQLSASGTYCYFKCLLDFLDVLGLRLLLLPDGVSILQVPGVVQSLLS
jgi:hypothetical protein